MTESRIAELLPQNRHLTVAVIDMLMSNSGGTLRSALCDDWRLSRKSADSDKPEMEHSRDQYLTMLYSALHRNFDPRAHLA